MISSMRVVFIKHYITYRNLFVRIVKGKTVKKRLLVRIGALLSGICISFNAVAIGNTVITVYAGELSQGEIPANDSGSFLFSTAEATDGVSGEIEASNGASDAFAVEGSSEASAAGSLDKAAEEASAAGSLDKAAEEASAAGSLNEASDSASGVNSGVINEIAGETSESEEENIHKRNISEGEIFTPEIIDYVCDESGFVHPGVGLTAEMLDTVQRMVNGGKDPWITYYNDMLVSSAASEDITINMADPENTAYNSQGTNGKFIKDALTAYTQAILYYVTGKNVYRKNCMDIIRQYEKLNPDSYAYFNDACIHTGIPMNRFCMAMEIMRCSTYAVSAGFSEEELEWTDEDTRLIISNLLRPSVETFMSSNDEFMNQHLYTTIGAMSAYLFMDDAAGYAKTVEWFTVNKDGANPGFNGSVKRLFREITTIDEIGMKEGEGTPLENPVIQHVEMGRDQAHGCGDLTNAVILSRLTNGQGTKVDPEYGTVSFSGEALGAYEFLNDRIANTADFFFKYMLGYDSEWVQIPFSMKADGTIIDNYTEFASGYRGRYSTINFWDIYTYYKYTRGMSDSEISAAFPYFWEGFMKKVPSNFMWNGSLNINWDNVDGGGDFWLFLPKEAADDENYIAKPQKDYLVEVEDRGSLVKNADKMSVCYEDGTGYVRIFPSESESKIAVTSGGGSGYETYAFRIRTDGIAEMSFENGVKGKVILPDTNGEWKYVTYSLSGTETFGDLYYLCFNNLCGSYVDIDSIDIKATDSNSDRTINVVNFVSGQDECSLVVTKNEESSLQLEANSPEKVQYSLVNAPEGAAIDEGGVLTVKSANEGTYNLYVLAASKDTVAVKKVTLYVAASREEAIEIAGRNYDESKDYVALTLQNYINAKNEAVEALSLGNEAFAEKLNALCSAAELLKSVSPLLTEDLYTEGDSLDLTEMIADTTLGNMIVLQDSDPTFCNRLDGKFNAHILDFGEDYKIKADKFGFKARLGFADRIAGVQVFGSNDKVNWEKLTDSEAAYTMAFQTVNVSEDMKNKEFRYLKLQKTTEYPESLRGAYSYMLEFSELRIWGQRVEIGNAIEAISISSDSASLGRIKMNDTVTVTIRTKLEVESIAVNIQGHVVNAIRKDDNLWTASAVMESGTKPGMISITVDYIKADQTPGNTMYGTTDGSALQLIDSDSYIDTGVFAKVLTATNGSWDKKSTPKQCAGYLFDKDISTFGDLLNANGDFYVIDYGENVSVKVKTVLMMPRSTAANHAARLNGARIYGTNDKLVFEADGSYRESSNLEVEWTAVTPAVSGALMNTWSEFGSDDILTDESFRYFKIAGAQQGDIAEVEIYGDYNSDIEGVAGAITSVPDQEPYKNIFTYPDIPAGYKPEIYSVDKPEILSLDGNYVAPQQDTVVNVVIKVTRLSDGAQGLTCEIPVTFKGIEELILVPKVIKADENTISNAAQYDGYSFTVETTSDEKIIQKSGEVRHLDRDCLVDVVFKVTRNSDGKSAVGGAVTVLVCGNNGGSYIDAGKLADISCSDRSDVSSYVFDNNINTFADVNTSVYHIVDFGEGKNAIITKVRVYPRSDSNDNNARRTEGAVLYGSFDGREWTALTLPVSGIVKGTWKEIDSDEFITFGKFRYYKIGGNTRGSMAEVELFGTYDNGELKGSFYTRWGATYFRLENGENATGLQRVNGKSYYFKANGAMTTSNYVTLDGKTYYFKADGTMATGFMEKWGAIYYFDENGALVKNKVVADEGDYYYVNSKGAMVKNEFVDLEDGRHYFASDGKMVIGRTIIKWTNKYTFDENGVLMK